MLKGSLGCLKLVCVAKQMWVEVWIISSQTANMGHVLDSKAGRSLKMKESKRPQIWSRSVLQPEILESMILICSYCHFTNNETIFSTFCWFSSLNFLSAIQYSSSTHHYQKQSLQVVCRIYYTIFVASPWSGSPFNHGNSSVIAPQNTKNTNQFSKGGEQQIYSGTCGYPTWRVA